MDMIFSSKYLSGSRAGEMVRPGVDNANDFQHQHGCLVVRRNDVGTVQPDSNAVSRHKCNATDQTP